MYFICIFLSLYPVYLFAGLIYKLKTTEEFLELMFSTIFFIAVPTLILGDLSSWETDSLLLGFYIGFTNSSLFHAWIEY